MPPGQPLLELSGVSKKYGTRLALHDVHLEVGHGEIHGLVGQNGSGKSTLIKVLAGYHAPEPGARMVLGGQEVSLPLEPDDPPKLGLAFVHQDLGFVRSATVVENYKAGRFRTGPAWSISWRRERAETGASLRRFDLDVDPDTPIASLDAADQAIVAIARSMDQLLERQRGGGGQASTSSDAAGIGVLVLDEPTAYLPPDGVTRLFQAMRKAASLGFGVLFVSHRLTEILQVTDRVTVLREGSNVGTFDTPALTESVLIEKILGFSIGELYPETAATEGREKAFSVRGVRGANVVDVDLDVHRGEILGLTGLLGTGFESIPYLLFGAKSASAGELVEPTGSHPLAQMSPRTAMRLGFALLPADRQRDSGNPDATMLENVTLPSLRRLIKRGFLDRRRERGLVQQLLVDFTVTPPSPAAKLSTFSGGNQQKGLIAKWFQTGPKYFLMHEPTQGIDIGSKKQIFQLIVDLAATGTPVILASAEHEDLAHLCHRVVIFRDGRVTGVLSGRNLTAHRILAQCLTADRGAGHA
jgi:ribose transport system ATP-binding protein